MPGMLWCSATQNRLEAELLDPPGQLGGALQGRGGGGSGTDGHEVEHGERHHGRCNPIRAWVLPGRR